MGGIKASGFVAGHARLAILPAANALQQALVRIGEAAAPGPLAALGISFASPSLGNYLSELSSFNTEVVGAAIGYQAFWDNGCCSITRPVGARTSSRCFFPVLTG